MNRLETLTILLAHYPDWLETGRGQGTSDKQDSRLLLHDQQLDCTAFDELERSLARMRNQGQQQAVKYQRQGGENDGATYSCSLATARWHLFAWYIPERYEQPRSYSRKRHGRNETIRPKPQPVRHKEARQDRAQAGLKWLNNDYDWDKATPGINWLRKEQKIPGLTHITSKAA